MRPSGSRAASSSAVPSPTERPPLSSTKRSQTRAASLIWWIERNSVRPPAAAARSTAPTSRVCRRSRPSNGSSQSSTGCGTTRPSASSTRLRCPFESVPMRASSSGVSERMSTTAARASALPPKKPTA